MAQVVMALVVTAQAGKAQGADGICVVFTYRSPDFHRALFSQIRPCSATRVCNS